MRLKDFQIHSTKKLDRLLAICCKMVLSKHRRNPEYWGMVGACVLGTDGRIAFGVNHQVDGGRDHAEVVALENYIEKYGAGALDGAVVVTTLSPCSTDIDQPGGRNCVDYLEDCGIKKVYCGWSDPTQDGTDNYLGKSFHVMETRDSQLSSICKEMAQTFLGKQD